MPSNRIAATPGTDRPSRRQFLGALGAVSSASIAGCSSVLGNGGSGGSDESIEVGVLNDTASQAEIAVLVLDSDDETLFSRVFSLESEAFTSGGKIETTPESVRAFTATGASHTWRYAPDLPADFECEREDIGLTLHRNDTIEPWYDC